MTRAKRATIVAARAAYKAASDRFEVSGKTADLLECRRLWDAYRKAEEA